MKIREVIEYLNLCDQDAEFQLIADNQAYKVRAMDFSFGGSEGTTISNAETVSIYMDFLNDNETKTL